MRAEHSFDRELWQELITKHEGLELCLISERIKSEMDQRGNIVGCAKEREMWISARVSRDWQSFPTIQLLESTLVLKACVNYHRSTHLSKLTETLNFLFSSPANWAFGSLLMFLSYTPTFALLLFALLLLALFWWIMLRLFCDGYGGRRGTEPCWLLCDDDLDLFASGSIGGNVQTSPLKWNPFDVRKRRMSLRFSTWGWWSQGCSILWKACFKGCDALTPKQWNLSWHRR